MRKICEDIKVVYDIFIYIAIHLTPIHLMTEVTSILGLNCNLQKIPALYDLSYVLFCHTHFFHQKIQDGIH